MIFGELSIFWEFGLSMFGLSGRYLDYFVAFLGCARVEKNGQI